MTTEHILQDGEGGVLELCISYDKSRIVFVFIHEKFDPIHSVWFKEDEDWDIIKWLYSTQNRKVIQVNYREKGSEGPFSAKLRLLKDNESKWVKLTLHKDSHGRLTRLNKLNQDAFKTAFVNLYKTTCNATSGL